MKVLFKLKIRFSFKGLVILNLNRSVTCKITLKNVSLITLFKVEIKQLSRFSLLAVVPDFHIWYWTLHILVKHEKIVKFVQTL